MLLLFVSAAWGSAFPLMKDLIARMPVADLLTERYGLAVLVLLAIRPKCLRGLSDQVWQRGILLGLLFGVGQTAQAVALHSLPSSVSGFAVGCNVVMTPLLGLFLLRARISKRIWAAVMLSAAAIAAFTLLRGVEEGDMSLLPLSATLFAAALYAGHTLVLGQTPSGPGESYAITVIQLGTIAVMTGILALPGGLQLPTGAADWAVLGHLAVVSCALGFLARTYGQAHVPAVPAAVILSSQPLWVAALAVIYGEALTPSVVLGGALIALAMLLVVIPGRVWRGGLGRRGPRRSGRPRRSPPSGTGTPAAREQLLRIRWRASEVLRGLQDDCSDASPGLSGLSGSSGAGGDTGRGRVTGAGPGAAPGPGLSGASHDGLGDTRDGLGRGTGDGPDARPGAGDPGGGDGLDGGGRPARYAAGDVPPSPGPAHPPGRSDQAHPPGPPGPAGHPDDPGSHEDRPPEALAGDSVVDQMVRHAIDVVRLRATPALIERCAPLLAVVDGADAEPEPDPDPRPVADRPPPAAPDGVLDDMDREWQRLMSAPEPGQGTDHRGTG